MRVLLLSPLRSSLYSRVLAHLIAREPGFELVGIVVRRPYSFKRLSSELRRDGSRLLNKVYQKMILGDAALRQSDQQTLLTVAQASGLSARHVQELARDVGCPCLTVGDHNDARSLEFIRQQTPDAIAFTGGGLIRRDLLAIPRLGVLNCHMGLLPHYRGMDVVEWPLLEARPEQPVPPELGLTVHFMDPGVDTGPILRSESISLERGDDFRRLRERLTARMPTLLLEVLRGLRDQTIDPQAQAASAGKQYYVMHPRLYELALQRLHDREKHGHG